MKTHFTGEHLLPGQLGHFLIILAFVSAMVATVAFFMASRDKDVQVDLSWKRLARGAYVLVSASFIGVFILMFYIIYHHYFEYQYVWEYSSRQLPLKFLLSSIWNGQEGSFLLWALWQSILGIVLMLTARKWESPVMTILSFAQVCLASMILGIYILGYKVGSNPFILFREANPSLPLFGNPDYLSFIKDGRGLNPLLQNYWMTIHPPILFCGFASTIVPFAFAFAGLWKRKYSEWTSTALPWALFSGMMLGTGVMMGAAWAYESLTFGGFWAWDPVENASLVPWLILIAGIHTLVIYRSTKHSLRSSYFFFLLAFILVLYSTFLTRSGILGSTSVHAFTDLGMNAQLLVYLFIFMIPGFVLFGIRYKDIPSPDQEEQTYSREFWMFIGSLVLFLSAVFITFSTSIPVWNKLFNLNMAPPVDQKFHYNKIQVFVAIFIGLSTAMVQYLKYKNTPKSYYLPKILWPTVVALVLGTLIALFGHIDYRDHGMGFLVALYLMMYAAVYGAVANLMYIFTALKGKLQAAGSAIAHVGFGLMLLGIVIAASRQTTISKDTIGLLDGYFPAGSPEAKTPRENLYLARNMPMQMGPYMVTYEGDSTAARDPKRYYKVHYERKDKQGRVVESFNLFPDAFINPQGQDGLIANPSSKHYWNRDIFTYVTSVFDPSKFKDTAQYEHHVIAPGDTVFFSNGYLLLESLDTHPASERYQPQTGDLAVGARLAVHDNDGHTYTAEPIYVLRDSSYQMSVPDTVSQLELYARFDRILPEQKKIDLAVKQSGAVNDYIVLKAFIFPYINVLWIGTLIMIFGFLISIRYRIRLRLGEREAAAAS